NAVCGNTSNAAYPFIYVGLGLAAAATHLIFDGQPAVGASGAINGVVGMALAMYPLNRVSVFWLLFFRMGTFQMPLWGLAVVWLLFDLYGAVMNSAGVAYWAHLGGFFTGLAAGYVALRVGLVKLTEIDHRSLEEIFTGKTAEARRARLRAEEAAENGDAEEESSEPAPVLRKNAGPWAQQAAAAGDPLVMPVTAPMVAGWSKAASATVVSAVDATVIEAGGADGERRKFELLYGASFLAMGYSFHRSLADYYRRVAGARIWPHDGPALAELLRIIEEDFGAMRACGFVDDELAGLRDEARLAEFLRAATVKKSVSA
ncbi:MAG: rhomboid family intramembrane serine protease, partial [Burkholderiales bacterium]|nr:rhomboid family intramembrane serine protease [Opitutaceae bacterium]